MSETFNPRIAVVIPVFNRLPLTLRFLEAFTKSTYTNYEVVIVDDGTQDSTAEINQKYPQVKTIRGPINSLWWAGGTNMGVRYALESGFDYVLTINNDAVVAPEYLQNLVDQAREKPNDLVCSLIMFENQDLVWAAGARINWWKSGLFELNYYKQPLAEVEQKVQFPLSVQLTPGDGVLIPVQVYRKIGLYDAKWFPQYHADSDFSMRARSAGYKIWVARQATLDNDIPAKPTLTSPKDLIFSKRSGNYWRPTVMMYLRYAPWYFKWGFIYAYAMLAGRFLLRRMMWLIKPPEWKRPQA